MAEKNPALRRRRTLNGLDSVAVLPKAELLRQLAQPSLRKPRYRHRVCRPGFAADTVWPRGSGVNFTVRETGVNPAAREDGEHFCEVPEQKFYIRRPNKSENCGRDRKVLR